MKRLCLIALGIIIASLAIVYPGWAKDSKIGGLEFSGNVDVLAGWQHDDSHAFDPSGSCPYGIGGLGCNAADTVGTGSGQLGDFRGLAQPSRDTFNFYLDQVEVDLQKSFGENIRIRADLDFGRFLSGSGYNTGAGSNFDLEQGYVTANIPIGNGLEFLIGRFNAPIGLESVDRPDNIALSFSNLYRYLRPHNITGAKLYYAFSDHFDWNVYVVNNLLDTISQGINQDSAVPSYGTRLGLTWGKQGKENTVGLSYAGGPEQYGFKSHLTNIVDLDFMVHVASKFALGGEVMYRQDNLPPSLKGLPNSKGFGAFMLFNFIPTDAWNIYFRYDFLDDVNQTAAYTGAKQLLHDFSIGAGYQIADNAKLKLEYRLDLHDYSASQPLGTLFIPGFSGTLANTTSLSNGLSAEFAYNF